MKFSDEINIYVSSGNGGNGAISFVKNNRKKNKTDGGNGGNGGNIFIKINKNYDNFSKISTKKSYKAINGENGSKNYKTGKNGENIYINVPSGTIVYDNERKIFLGEISKENEIMLIAKGGKGGIGNNFTNNKSLHIGKSGEIKYIHLELFLIADIGLIGFPNVGKSLFLNTFTNAFSKVENYDFTTITPHSGFIKNQNKSFIKIIDVPGIIKNANLGKGLGFNFLKHLLKCKLLMNIIDAKKTETKYSFIKNVLTLNKELNLFDINFLKKKKWLIINKTDLIKNNVYKNHDNIYQKFNYNLIFFISLKKKNGLKKLIFNINEYFKTER